MASAAPPEDDVPGETITVVRRPSPWWRVAKWLAIILATLVALGAAFLLWLNSDWGRRYVVDQINALEMESGLRIHVDSIDGSLFSQMTIRGLTLSDGQGAFFAAPVAEVDYAPFVYLQQGRIDITSLGVPEARLARLPSLISTDPNAPMIPDIDLAIGEINVGRLQIDPAVSGTRNFLSITGGLALSNSEARSTLNVAALTGPNLAGGDRLRLVFEAAPQRNLLNIDATLQAPGNGVVAGMAGLTEALDVRIGGRGDWANWQGRVQATKAGQGFADLNLRAQNGTFTLVGPLRPDLFVTGPAQRLTEPRTDLMVTARWADRRVDMDLRMQSAAVAIASRGIIDLSQSRFEGLQVAARLLRPGAIAPNLSGRDVRLALVLDGAFATPTVAYDLQAATIGMAGRTIQDLRARGAARVDADRIVVPVHATMASISGLPDMVGGLATNVRMDGDLAIDGTNVLSDNLRVRSPQLDVVLALAFDIARGRYNVGIQGRVNDFVVQSVGVFDINSDFDVVATADGGFGMSGRVSLRSKRIFNATAADLLGGDAVASANIALAGDGAIRIANIRLTAPQLRITEGGGVYYPDGRLALRLVGTSARYGAIAVDVGGSITAPVVELRVASPGFGVGLRDVRVNLRATAQGYAVLASGGSDYGPFSADVLILSNRGPLTIQVNRLLFAGLTATGRIAATAAGPFAGSLSVTGQGVNGTVALAAAGARQQVTVNAAAQNASIPGSLSGTTAISIQRALIDATIILPGANDRFAIYQANGDVQIAGLTMSGFTLTQARANITYAGNSGTARFVATGASGVPFDVAGNAELSPERIRAAMQGTANNIPFRFAQPALIERAGSDWILRPTSILCRDGQGQLRLAGRFGSDMIVQARLDNLDLSIANTMVPSLGIGGQATGSLDFVMPGSGAFPRAEARLNIANFTRTGIVTRSVPVNLALAGNLRPEGGGLAAVIRQNDAVIGRVRVQLQPLGGGASWMERLMSAPLSGGIRYAGPASVLTSLANMAGHHLDGPIGIGADFSGRVDNPQFSGVVRGQGLAYTNETYGTRITEMAFQGRFSGSDLQLTSFTGRAGEGTIQASGSVGFSSAAGYPIRLDVALNNARLARSDDVSATASGRIEVRNSREEPAVIRGQLDLGEIRYRIVRQASAQVPQLGGVRRRGEPLLDPNEQRESQEGSIPSSWRLDLALVADDQLYVSGMGLESEWRARLQVGGTTAAPTVAGNVSLIRGTLGLAGRRFELDRGSNITFAGGRTINPQLAIQATADIDDVQVEVNVAGNAYNPQISFASTPGLPQDEVISRILFGSSVTEISAIQAVQLAASLNSLRGGSGGLDPLGSLQRATGIDRLRILGGDDTTGRGTAVAAGFYLSEDVYVEIITDAQGFTATQIELSLSRTLSVLSQFGTNTNTNVNLRYSRDY